MIFLNLSIDEGFQLKGLCSHYIIGTERKIYKVRDFKTITMIKIPDGLYIRWYKENNFKQSPSERYIKAKFTRRDKLDNESLEENVNRTVERIKDRFPNLRIKVKRYRIPRPFPFRWADISGYGGSNSGDMEFNIQESKNMIRVDISQELYEHILAVLS